MAVRGTGSSGSVCPAHLFHRTGRRVAFGAADWIALSIGVAVLVGLLGMHRDGLAGSAAIAVDGIGRAAEEAGDGAYIRYQIWKSTLDIALGHWVKALD